MLKVILTGPESCGKTTICKALSDYFKTPYCKEYAREYLKKDLKYNQEDLYKIAKIQLKSEQDKRILDTDLITIKIWSDFKFGNCENWILNQINKQRHEKRFYLLCRPDIEWEADPLRENPNNRIEIFETYKNTLEKLGHNFSIIKGTNRNYKAILKIQEISPDF